MSPLPERWLHSTFGRPRLLESVNTDKIMEYIKYISKKALILETPEFLFLFQTLLAMYDLFNLTEFGFIVHKM